MMLGRYEVVRELARGGMGRVLEARDHALGRDVAIKTLLRAGDAVLRARFVEEAQVTAQLAHPNVVAVHELGEHQGAPFLVMRLVRGRTLKELARALADRDVATRRGYGVPRLVRLFLKACEAVGHAHERGVIHRDLKPANVMVDEGDDVQVMDWGLARPIAQEGAAPSSRRGARPTRSALSTAVIRSAVREDLSAVRPAGGDEGGQAGDLTSMGDVVGTPAYMPPEQADGGIPLDARADVYSLGAILYELLTHRPPYTGSHLEVLTMVLREVPPAPRSTPAGKDLPAALEAVLLRAMARDRADRYPDAGALALDVEAWLDGRAVSAYRERPLEALRRVLRRNRALVATAAASFLAVNLALGLGTLVVSREEGRVRAEAAAAEGAQRDAEARAGERVAASRRSDDAARALAIAGRSAQVLAELERRVQTPLPVSGGAGPGGSLVAVHAAGREELERLGEELVALGAGEAAAPFVAELAQARVAADRIFADALLARAPSRLLEEARELSLGDEAPVLLARAHQRLRRPKQALKVLGEAPGPLALALRAALLERDPTAGAPPGMEGVAVRLERTIEGAPGRAWLHLLLAEAQARLGRFEAATQSYERAAQLSRFDAWIYSSRLLHTYPVHHHYDELAGITAGLVSSPEDLTAATLPERVALWNFGASRWADLEKAAAELSKRDPLLAAARRAEAALVLARWSDADAAAREGLRLDADDATCLGALAEARLEQGDADGAEGLAVHGLRVLPEDGRLNVTLGRVRVLQGRLVEATPLLRLGARGAIVPDPWRHLAECLLAQDRPADWEEGVAAARRALSFDPYAVVYYGAPARPVPGDPRLERVLGHLRRKQGRPAAAVVHYVRALHFASGRWPTAAMGLDLQDALHCGDAHQELGLLDAAAHFYERALEDPRVGSAARERLAAIVEGRRPR